MQYKFSPSLYISIYSLQDNSHQRNRLNSVLSDKSVGEVATSQPGLLVLPHGSATHVQKDQA